MREGVPIFTQYCTILVDVVCYFGCPCAPSTIYPLIRAIHTYLYVWLVIFGVLNFMKIRNIPNFHNCHPNRQAVLHIHAQYMPRRIGCVLSDRVLVLLLSNVYYLANHGYRISAILLHSCSNSIDTAVLDCSRLLFVCEGEIQSLLFLLASCGKLHFFVYFSKDVWSNRT